MDNNEKATYIADQSKPCSDDYYNGIYQGVLIGLNPDTIYNMRDDILKKLVKKIFDNATDEDLNGEEAINLDVKRTNGKIKVMFDVDLGRGGIRENNYVTIQDEKIIVSLCEAIEGGGIEEIIENELHNELFGTKTKNSYIYIV